MKTVFEIAGKVLVSIIVAAAVAMLSAVFFQLAWNYVAPSLFHLPPLTYWQAWAVNYILAAFTAPIRNSAKTEA